MCKEKCPRAAAQTSTQFEVQEFQGKAPEIIQDLRTIAQTAADLANRLEAQVKKFTSSMKEGTE